MPFGATISKGKNKAILPFGGDFRVYTSFASSVLTGKWETVDIVGTYTDLAHLSGSETIDFTFGPEATQHNWVANVFSFEREYKAPGYELIFRLIDSNSAYFLTEKVQGYWNEAIDTFAAELFNIETVTDGGMPIIEVYGGGRTRSDIMCDAARQAGVLWCPLFDGKIRIINVNKVLDRQGGVVVNPMAFNEVNREYWAIQGTALEFYKWDYSSGEMDVSEQSFVDILDKGVSRNTGVRRQYIATDRNARAASLIQTLGESKLNVVIGGDQDIQPGDIVDIQIPAVFTEAAMNRVASGKWFVLGTEWISKDGFETTILELTRWESTESQAFERNTTNA